VRWTYYGRIVLGDDGRRLKFPVIAGSPHAEDHLTPVYWAPDTKESVEKAYIDKHYLRPTPALMEKMRIVIALSFVPVVVAATWLARTTSC
jgi:hypothetical protein